MKSKTVIIIGGGMAGLIAARNLSLKYNIIVLEALSRFGGRIHTIRDENFSAPIEGGAEFLHGEAEETISLLNEAGIEFNKIEGKLYRSINNKLQPQQGMAEGWDLIVSKMKTVNQDMTLEQFLLAHFSDKKFNDLCSEVKSFAQGFDLADSQRVSVMSLYQEWSNQSDDYRISGGYGDLIQFLSQDCLVKGCKLISNAAVKEIKWDTDDVSIITCDQNVYQGSKCLITVALEVLQQDHRSNYLKFNPPVKDYMRAIKQIGIGSVVKIILEFKEVFWKKDASFFMSDESFGTWWTQLPKQVPILTGWVGGPDALVLNKQNDTQLLETALNSLSAIFNRSMHNIKESLVAWQVFNWSNQEHVLCAYSYAMPETAAALKILNTPLKNTVYFAGEAFYAGIHPGTIEAAIVSAKQAVERMTIGV